MEAANYLGALSKNGTMRYNELKRSIDDITNMMLTQSLKELEEDGIISRKQFNEVPPRVEYSLTENGKSLIPALKALADWGKKMKDCNQLKLMEIYNNEEENSSGIQVSDKEFYCR